MNIVLLLKEAFYEADKNLIPELETIGEVKVLHTDNGIGKEQLKAEVKDADIILVNIVKLDKEVLDAAPNLKCIIKYGAGIDNIDVDYAKQKGIRVTSAPGVNAPAVADHAFGLMLSAARKIPKKDSEVKSGVWQTEMGFEVSGKTLGIIGFGAIGKELAKRATGFSMKTLVYGNHKDYVLAEQLNAHFVDKDVLFSEADFIVVATSLTAKNRHLVNAETLSQMKPTAFLVNISRGQLVDEKALAESLQKGEIAGAALDVFEQEPPVSGLPKLENVVATPHIGGATYEAVARISKLSVSNIRKLQKGDALDFEIK
ncbi:D-3-phosphoglycerate dehydrogenase [Planomicrobium koreense]|uniref:D-3-phosphoglycerate dehydrogenase n=1 Tax=Planococcus koreensis TaxID=112331 RepID=A0A7W8CTN7_9BACL|nr:phosphoglycerate dehydrogenase [Planococcus koreensis]MBB5179795.1 D-3-phosphoglycerate dehydrogenase [Planococcus koreensis]